MPEPGPRTVVGHTTPPPRAAEPVGGRGPVEPTGGLVAHQLVGARDQVTHRRPVRQRHPEGAGLDQHVAERGRLGRTATDLLLAETTESDHVHRRVLFTPELVARTSTLG